MMTDSLQSILNTFKTEMDSLNTEHDKPLRSLVLTTMLTRNFAGALDLGNTNTFKQASSEAQQAIVSFLRAIHGEDVYDELGTCKMDIYAAKVKNKQIMSLVQMLFGLSCGAAVGLHFLKYAGVTKYIGMLHRLNTTEANQTSSITLNHIVDNTDQEMNTALTQRNP